jgi:fluoroquinolone resistance protein
MPLQAQEFENQVFKKESFVDLDLKHKSFSCIVFDGCDLSRSHFKEFRFLDCKFINCNLSLIKLDGCRLQEVYFENCKLVGVNFSQIDRMFLAVQFKKCLIGMSNFSVLDLKKTIFHECVIRETFFNETNLSHADFAGSDLNGSVFHNANLSEASFVAAMNYSINPLANKLHKTKFSKPEVMSLLNHLDIMIE